MELQELFNIIKDELTANGFKQWGCLKDGEAELRRTDWVIGDEASLEQNVDYGFTMWNGYTLAVEKVYTFSKTQKTISFYLRVMKWQKSTGSTLECIKISSTQTEKTLRRKIKDFIEQKYLQIIK